MGNFLQAFLSDFTAAVFVSLLTFFAGAIYGRRRQRRSSPNAAIGSIDAGELGILVIYILLMFGCAFASLALTHMIFGVTIESAWSALPVIAVYLLYVVVSGGLGFVGQGLIASTERSGRGSSVSAFGSLDARLERTYLMFLWMKIGLVICALFGTLLIPPEVRVWAVSISLSILLVFDGISAMALYMND